MKMIDDFDDLVDPRTLAHHFLGLKPSSFILRAIEIEEKSDFFFYTFSSFFLFFLFWRRNDDQVQSGDVCQDKGQEEQVPFEPREEVVWVVEKGVSVSPAVSVPKAMRTASPTTSL